MDDDDESEHSSMDVTNGIQTIQTRNISTRGIGTSLWSNCKFQTECKCECCCCFYYNYNYKSIIPITTDSRYSCTDTIFDKSESSSVNTYGTKSGEEESYATNTTSNTDFFSTRTGTTNTRLVIPSQEFAGINRHIFIVHSTHAIAIRRTNHDIGQYGRLQSFGTRHIIHVARGDIGGGHESGHAIPRGSLTIIRQSVRNRRIRICRIQNDMQHTRRHTRRTTRTKTVHGRFFNMDCHGRHGNGMCRNGMAIIRVSIRDRDGGGGLIDRRDVARIGFIHATQSCIDLCTRLVRIRHRNRIRTRTRWIPSRYHRHTNHFICGRMLVHGSRSIE